MKAARLEPRVGRERTKVALKPTLRSFFTSTNHRFKDSVPSAPDKSAARRAVAALAGAMAFPAFPAWAAGPDILPEPAAAEAPAPAASEPKPEPGRPSETCVAETICGLKNRVRWRSAAWSPSYCRLIAKGVLTASSKYDVSPALLMAIMLNESDLDEKAVVTHVRGTNRFAKDSGLMGIRCIIDEKGRCTNGNVRGLAWKTVMDPVKNIELGARELAYWRAGGGVTKVTVRKRDKSGNIVEKTKIVPCQHKTHAYWAHYNHGPRYIDHGPARHYPHRIAVLYSALAKTLDMPAPELHSMRITINDPGMRPRTPDRPVEARYRILCEKIRSIGQSCSSNVTASAAPAAAAVN